MSNENTHELISVHTFKYADCDCYLVFQWVIFAPLKEVGSYWWYRNLLWYLYPLYPFHTTGGITHGDPWSQVAEPPPRSPHFSDSIWCQCPATVMLRWFPWFIHGDTGFPQDFSLFSMVVDLFIWSAFSYPDSDVWWGKVPKGCVLVMYVCSTLLPLSPAVMSWVHYSPKHL